MVAHLLVGLNVAVVMRRPVMGLTMAHANALHPHHPPRHAITLPLMVTRRQHALRTDAPTARSVGARLEDAAVKSVATATLSYLYLRTFRYRWLALALSLLTAAAVCRSSLQTKCHHFFRTSHELICPPPPETSHGHFPFDFALISARDLLAPLRPRALSLLTLSSLSPHSLLTLSSLSPHSLLTNLPLSAEFLFFLQSFFLSWFFLQSSDCRARASGRLSHTDRSGRRRLLSSQHYLYWWHRYQVSHYKSHTIQAPPPRPYATHSHLFLYLHIYIGAVPSLQDLTGFFLCSIIRNKHLL